MKIDFAGKTLCTAVGTDSPIDFEYSGESDEQVAKWLRAASAKVFPRLNEQTHISFQLFKPQVSIQAAQKLVLNSRQLTYLPHYGTLTLTADDGSHQNTSVMYLPNAHFKGVKAKYKGCLVWLTFSFSGGALTPSKP